MKLFVANIAWETTEDELRNLFGKYGRVVSVRIITDRETGKSRGFGFVEMADDAEANAALAELNGASVGRRTLTVREANDSQPIRR